MAENSGTDSGSIAASNLTTKQRKKNTKMPLSFEVDENYIPVGGGRDVERRNDLEPTLDVLADNGLNNPDKWVKLTLPVEPEDEKGILEWRHSWAALANSYFEDARILIKADGNVLRGRLLEGSRKPRAVKPTEDGGDSAE